MLQIVYEHALLFFSSKYVHCDYIYILDLHKTLFVLKYCIILFFFVFVASKLVVNRAGFTCSLLLF